MNPDKGPLPALAEAKNLRQKTRAAGLADGGGWLRLAVVDD